MADYRYQKQWTKAAETLTELDQKVLEVAKKEVKVIEKKLMKTVEKKVVGYKYFVVYNGPHLHLSISPDIGRVERGITYQVSLELYNSLKGLEGWSARMGEVTQ